MAYRRRVLRQFQQYCPDFAAIDLSNITDPEVFRGIEKRIYADAAAVGAKPDNWLPRGQLTAFTNVNPETGQRIVTFHGDIPSSRR